jgi:hypothetical protein
MILSHSLITPFLSRPFYLFVPSSFTSPLPSTLPPYIKQFRHMSIKTCRYWRSVVMNMNLVTKKHISLFSRRTAFLPRASKQTSHPSIHIHTGFYNYRRCEIMYVFYRMMCPDRLGIYGVFQTRRVTTSLLSANKQTSSNVLCWRKIYCKFTINKLNKHLYVRLAYMCQSTNLHVSPI